jgi:hypothetical protein
MRNNGEHSEEKEHEYRAECKKAEECKTLCLQSDNLQQHFLSTFFYPLEPTTNQCPFFFFTPTKQAQDIKSVRGNWEDPSMPVRTTDPRHDTPIKTKEQREREKKIYTSPPTPLTV